MTETNQSYESMYKIGKKVNKSHLQPNPTQLSTTNTAQHSPEVREQTFICLGATSMTPHHR